jgi:uncharacterized damage-inducible protein DinB
MTINEANELFGYGSWANARMFEAAESLPEEQVVAGATSSFPSVGATLAHIVGAEWIWLRRWLGDNPRSFPAWTSTYPGLMALRAELTALEAERASFLARLTDGDLDREVTYRRMDGQAFSQGLGQLIRHVVNHSTYHRGQLAAQLRQLGHAPPSTDFVRYLRDAT